MNGSITSTGGRASPTLLKQCRIACDRAGNAENLVGLAQLAVLLLERLHPFGHLGRNARALAAVDLGLLAPVVQRLWCTQPIFAAIDITDCQREPRWLSL